MENTTHPRNHSATVPLGLDMFSLRSQDWTPFQKLDFCARWGLSVVHFSEPRQIGGLEPELLDRVRRHAESLGIALEIGMRSICPSAGIFDVSLGTADEQIASLLAAARAIGSPIVRAVVGRFDDRTSPGGIERRIDDTVDVLRRVRSRVLDAGVKIAIENHAGDLQARELKALTERAGPEFVGVCLDSGNALWAVEDPHLTLDTLAPYVLTSHIRDGAVWRTPEGARVEWTRMGEGNIRMGDFLRAFVQKCPGRPISLEIITTIPPRLLNFRDPAFWDGYRQMPAWEFCRFLALAEHEAPAAGPIGALTAERELEDVEVSVRWTKEFLGI